MEVASRMLDPMGIQTLEVETVGVVTADLAEIREEVVTAAADAIAEEAAAVINREWHKTCGLQKRQRVPRLFNLETLCLLVRHRGLEPRAH